MKKIIAAMLTLCLIFGLCSCGDNTTKYQKKLKSAKVAVLMYHNLTEDPDQVNSLTITKERMEEDLQWLKDNGFQTLLPREVAAISSGLEMHAYCEGLDDESDCTIGDKIAVITLDDGYMSNYTMLYPLLQKYGFKAEINVIVHNIDFSEYYTQFANWEVLKEMSDSGLVEIGSHTDNLHNPLSGGLVVKGEANGVQRKKDESDEDYRIRVTEDLKYSVRRIEEKVGIHPVTFAYPFGENDKYSEKTISECFGISFITRSGKPQFHKSLYNLPRYGVKMDTKLSDILK